MAINLVKGQTIDPKKSDFDLSTVTIGLGWDVRQKSSGFMGKLFGGGNNNADADLDAVAFLLDNKDQVNNLGGEMQLQNGTKVGLFQSDVIFFNNISAPSGTGLSAGVYQGKSQAQIQAAIQQMIQNGEFIIHTGDNLTGEGMGDDEQIIVRLDQVPAQYHKILFLVCIYQGASRGQHFGMIENAFIRAVDAKNREIARYNLSNEATFDQKRSMIFAELYRKDSGWKFRALGNPESTDNFVDILKGYVRRA